MIVNVASVRLINWLSSSYKDKKFFFLEDALYSTAPNIRQIRENNWNFILNVKPDGNKYLFKMWETRKRLKERIFSHTCKENEVEYEFSYMNNVCINETNSDVRVNFCIVNKLIKKVK